MDRAESVGVKKGAAPEVRVMKLAALTPAPYNPRTISEEAARGLRASLRRFGLVQPIVWNSRTKRVVGGHQRVDALKALGKTDAQVVVVDLPETEEKALNVTLNNPAIGGEFTDGLQAILIELSEMPDLEFEELRLDALLDADLGVFEDEVPEPPKKAVTKPGDLWELGRHRLLCGDSSKPQDVDRLLADGTVHLVNTDPPYNVKVEPRSNNAIAAGLSSFKTLMPQQAHDLARHKVKARPTGRMRAKDRPLQNDFIPQDRFHELLRAWFGQIATRLIPGGSFYIWGGYHNVFNYPPAITDVGLFFSQLVIWVKEHPVLTRKDFMGNHELCFYGWREGAAHRFLGPSNVPDVWSVKKITPNKMVHLTEKPVELAARAISYSSKQGENVLDLFGGSGSTMAAAEQLSRSAFLIEIDPPYCDVIVERWQNLSGKKASRAGR